MSDLQGLIQRTKLYILSKGKGIVLNHKKKLIAAVILFIAGYIIKKKMTMAHLISIIEVVSKLVQYLPLPDSPQIRLLTSYEHPQSVPLRAIMNAVKVEEIKSRIGRKQGTWDELKDSIFTGATLTLVLYNINSFYFVVQNKYQEEFKQLKATQQFDQAMYIIRKRFTDQIPRIFTDLQVVVQHELNKIDLQEVYNLEQVGQIFDQLIGKVFESKFNVGEQQKKSNIWKVQKQISHLFTSVFEYNSKQSSSSFLIRASKSILRMLGGTLNVFDWFPTAKQEVSPQRYDFIRRAYLMSILKADVQSVRWPSEASRLLFDLVFEEVIYLILSLNFSVLMVEHCRYNRQVLLNRINLWFIANKCSSAKTVKMLPAIFKILKEQFFKDDVYQLRDAYHEKELKRNIKLVAIAEQVAESEEVSIEEAVLMEIEGKKAYQYLEKEFQLKYFNERSGVVHRPKKQESEGRQARDMEKMLSMLGGSEALNQRD